MPNVNRVATSLSALFMLGSVAACGGGASSGGTGGSSGAGGAGGGQAGASGGVGGDASSFPASEPADVCSLLTLADVQSIIPTAAPGVASVGGQNSSAWSLQCSWTGDANAGVALLIEGAKTSAEISQFDLAIQDAEVTTGGVQIMPISGVGDEAVYVNDTRMNAVQQELQAVSGSYWVGLVAAGFTTPVTLTQLQPLVVKVLSEL